MNVYQSLYNLIVTYVFGGAVPNEFQSIAIEIFCLFAWLFCLAFPFFVCFMCFRFLASLFERLF